MVGRTNTNTNPIDEDDEFQVCRKMKPLNQIQDVKYKNGEKEEKGNEGRTQKQYEERVGEEDEERESVMPIGDVIRVSDLGNSHFKAFELDGVHFHLEDPVLVSPEDEKAKPSVAIIKDIFQTIDEELMISGQRFYRPEEAEKERGGTWQRHDPRELFYSCHLDDLPANSVMHRCIIHLLPLPKPLPNRKLHPGFIVRRVYDPVLRKLRDLTDRDCEGSLIRRGMAESV